MSLVFASTTVASMDAGAEPTRMYLRRVVMANTEFMPLSEPNAWKTLGAEPNLSVGE